MEAVLANVKGEVLGNAVDGCNSVLVFSTIESAEITKGANSLFVGKVGVAPEPLELIGDRLLCVNVLESVVS